MAIRKVGSISIIKETSLTEALFTIAKNGFASISGNCLLIEMDNKDVVGIFLDTVHSDIAVDDGSYGFDPNCYVVIAGESKVKRMSIEAYAKTLK